MSVVKRIARAKRCRKAICVSITVVVLAVLDSSPVRADPVSAGTLNREIEENLPQIKQAKPSPEAMPAKPAAEQPAAEEAPPQKLLYPVKLIDVQTPRFTNEITALLHDRFMGKKEIAGSDVAQARTAIWEMFRAQGFLVYADLSFTPDSEAEGSHLRATVTEMRVRNVTVEQEGAAAISPSVLNNIQNTVNEAFPPETVLDLNELDSQLKWRLFLNDVTIRASVEPVDANQLDLKILVGAKPYESAAYMAQYDNTGAWSLGADRFTGGASKSNLLFAGDRADAIFLKTMDIGGLDSQGIYYGRASYEVPDTYLGVRFSAWGSAMHYHADSGLTATTNANGDSMEIGGGVNRPLYIGHDMSALGHIEFLEKWETDRLLTNVVTADKSSHNGRVRVDGDYALSQTQALSGSFGATVGSMDLSGDSAALTQDQAGPKVNGVFSKFEGDGKWLGHFGGDNKIDTRLEARGQFASKNLDSLEKFTLGGPAVLRAFSSSEASGDEGYIVNAETGYALYSWLRTAAFYDVGGIVRIKNRFASTDTIPNAYVLQDAGVAFSSSYQSIDTSLIFAHEIGHNPGLSANGVDADNTKQRFRLFATMSYRF